MSRTHSLFALTILTASFSLLGLGCKSNEPTLKPIALTYWRASDTPDSLAPIIADYRKTHPNVSINVTTILSEQYEDKLITALAEDRGPDLFSLPNVKIREWQPRLSPMPKETKTSVQLLDANQKPRIVTQTTPSITLRQLLNNYVEAVPDDILLTAPSDIASAPPEQRVFGLPLSLDTLALYYNKDFLNRANIAKPASTWSEFQTQARQLTVLDQNQNITLSGASFGTANNVRYSTEILSTLMAQNGAIMSDESGQVTFESNIPNNPSPNPPAVDALIFYESFATRGSQNYTWDTSFPDALDAFTSGKTAYYIGFPADMSIIRTRAPKLNFAIAPMPQINKGRPAHVAKFDVEVVSKKTKFRNEAWDFIQFATSQEEVGQFLSAAKHPTALRGLIKGQLDDPDLAPFASQVLTAQSWYKGVDYTAVEQIFAQMISTKLTSQQPSYNPIVQQASAQVNGTLR